MSILHTSDLHLSSVGDERWKALEAVVDRAVELGVSVLTVGGDLFDRDVDAEQLRPDLRSLFSGNPFRVVIVSGNHDDRAVRAGLHFGNNVDLVTDPEEPVVLADANLRFWGIPYEDLGPEEVYGRVRSIAESLTDENEWLDCLLYHGQLVHGDYRNDGFGDEGSGQYMPLRLEYLEDSGLDYVLAGHYHTRARSHSYTGGTFLYPGSPVPVTRSETGPRHCYHVKNGDGYEALDLDRPYYENLEVTLRPDDTDSPLDRIRARLDALEERVRPILTVEGYFDGRRFERSESELDREVRDELSARDGETDYEFRARDVGGVLDSDLYADFEKRLSEERVGDDPDDESVREMVLEAMMRAGMTREAD